MCVEMHVGDIGVAFRVTVKNQDDEVVDLSSASSLQINFKQPDGTLLEKTATLYTDGTDGIMQYVSVSGFLNQAGKWQIQGFVEVSGGSWYTDITTFNVSSNLE